MDITDNKRICKILDILNNSKKAISGENIGIELGITSRTVRSDIKKLSEYLKDNGARVVSTTPRKGKASVLEALKPKEDQGVPIVAQWLTNPTRNHEVAGFGPCPCSVG